MNFHTNTSQARNRRKPAYSLHGICDAAACPSMAAGMAPHSSCALPQHTCCSTPWTFSATSSTVGCVQLAGMIRNSSCKRRWPRTDFSITPTLHTSAAGLQSYTPSVTSGSMNAAVPAALRFHITLPRVHRSMRFAMLASMMTTSPLAFTRTLSGLMSRCR